MSDKLAVKLTAPEKDFLKSLLQCAEGKGLIVQRDERKIVNSLVRKGLAWTASSVFTVCIVTDAGRKWWDEHYG